MNLHNRTRYPETIIKSVILRAGKHAGANVEGVQVVINQGRKATVSGLAYYADSVRIDKVKEATNGGWFSLSIPCWHLWDKAQRAKCRVDAVELAYRIYWTAFHEWHHVREYQMMEEGYYFPWSRRKNGRRPPYKERPEEIRAMGAEAEARAKPLDRQTQAAVLALAMWMEGT